MVMMLVKIVIWKYWNVNWYAIAKDIAYKIAEYNEAVFLVIFPAGIGLWGLFIKSILKSVTPLKVLNAAIIADMETNDKRTLKLKAPPLVAMPTNMPIIAIGM